MKRVDVEAIIGQEVAIAAPNARRYSTPRRAVVLGVGWRNTSVGRFSPPRYRPGGDGVAVAVTFGSPVWMPQVVKPVMIRGLWADYEREREETRRDQEQYDAQEALRRSQRCREANDLAARILALGLNPGYVGENTDQVTLSQITIKKLVELAEAGAHHSTIRPPDTHTRTVEDAARYERQFVTPEDRHV